MKEPIGEIKCPLCQRSAELHASADRKKLDPESEGGAGKSAYPRKFYVVCPPTTGYRGCGTILANGAEAQARMMDLGRIHGPSKKASESAPNKPAAKLPPASVAEPAHGRAAVSAGTSPAAPSSAAAPPAKKNPFSLWNW